MKKAFKVCKHCALDVVRRSEKWSPTNLVWWGSICAISSYRGNRPTNTQTNT